MRRLDNSKNSQLKLLQLKESRRKLNQLPFFNRMIVVYLEASLISLSS